MRGARRRGALALLPPPAGGHTPPPPPPPQGTRPRPPAHPASPLPLPLTITIRVSFLEFSSEKNLGGMAVAVAPKVFVRFEFCYLAALLP